MLLNIKDMERSAKPIEPLRGKGCNVDYLVTVAPVNGWDLTGSKGKVSVLEQQK